MASLCNLPQQAPGSKHRERPPTGGPGIPYASGPPVANRIVAELYEQITSRAYVKFPRDEINAALTLDDGRTDND